MVRDFVQIIEKTRPNRSTRSVDQTQKTCHESDKRFKRDIQYVKVNLEHLQTLKKYKSKNIDF